MVAGGNSGSCCQSKPIGEREFRAGGAENLAFFGKVASVFFRCCCQVSHSLVSLFLDFPCWYRGRRSGYDLSSEGAAQGFSNPPPPLPSVFLVSTAVACFWAAGGALFFSCMRPCTWGVYFTYSLSVYTPYGVCVCVCVCVFVSLDPSVWWSASDVPAARDCSHAVAVWGVRLAFPVLCPLLPGMWGEGNSEE